MTTDRHRVECPLCAGSSTFLLATRDRNRRSTTVRFTYHRCDRCGVVFLVNVPSDLGRHYPEQYYGVPSPEHLERLARSESHKVDLIRRYVEPGRLVEVGSGYGSFAHRASRAGFDVAAIEMDPRCCEYLTSQVGVEAVQTDEPARALRAMPPSRAVVLSHVLEHLSDPWQCLEGAAGNLEPGGVLLAASPNPRALQFRVLRSRWPHVDAPRHLFLIPADVLVSRAEGMGLECVLLTTSGVDARRQNRFGWAHFLIPPGAPMVLSFPARIWGAIVAGVLAPLERRGLNGSTYTAVFRKAGDGGGS